MARLTGLWWWIDRWRKSTAYTDMTLEEQGAYRNLLDEASLRGGPLPNDEFVLAKACGDPRRWAKVKQRVLSHFTMASDGWRNETLDEVLRESARRATNQANYRARRDNKHDNGNGNRSNNNHANKADSPDPDPVKRDLKISLPKEPADPRVKEFLQWFQPEYRERRHGADYLVKWPKDAPLVKQMLAATELPRLKLLAQILLSDKTDDPFIVESDRGIGILSVKFNWLSDRLAEWETRQKTRS